MHIIKALPVLYGPVPCMQTEHALWKQPGESFNGAQPQHENKLTKCRTWSQTHDWWMWHIGGMRSGRLWGVTEPAADIKQVFVFRGLAKGSKHGLGFQWKQPGIRKTTCKCIINWNRMIMNRKRKNMPSSSWAIHVSVLNLLNYRLAIIIFMVGPHEAEFSRSFQNFNFVHV